MTAKPHNCTHEWEECGFTRTMTGTCWRTVDKIHYCGKCNLFGAVRYQDIDGSMCSAPELPAVREKEQAEYQAAKREWLEKRNALSN